MYIDEDHKFYCQGRQIFKDLEGHQIFTPIFTVYSNKYFSQHFIFRFMCNYVMKKKKCKLKIKINSFFIVSVYFVICSY